MTARTDGQRPGTLIRLHPREAVFVIARMRCASVCAVIWQRLRMPETFDDLDEADGKAARLNLKSAQVTDEAFGVRRSVGCVGLFERARKGDSHNLLTRGEQPCESGGRNVVRRGGRALWTASQQAYMASWNLVFRPSSASLQKSEKHERLFLRTTLVLLFRGNPQRIIFSAPLRWLV